MTLTHELRRFGARVLAPIALAASLLAACGGGTSQVEAFQPTRLVVLGDETSLMVDRDGSSDGYRYGINDRRGTAAGKCLLEPSFWQQLASLYGFFFAACNPEAATVKAFTFARAGATVADATTGLARQIADVPGGLGTSDMVSVMIGTNDIIAAYERVRDGLATEAEAQASVEATARQAAGLISGLLGTGARAIVLTVPNLSLSPYGAAEEARFPGARALLSRLTLGTTDRPGGYNGYLRTEITPSDGRQYGLVVADDVVAQMHRFPESFLSSPNSVGAAACSGAALDCVITDTTSTLVTGATVNTHLWATDRHLGPAAHRQIGQQVQSRAVNNPF